MNFSPMNPTASLGIQIVMIILRADTYHYLDQVLSTKSTEFILLLYHTISAGYHSGKYKIAMWKILKFPY